MLLWWKLRQLNSKKPEIRRQAAKKLGASKNARVVYYLIAALKDKDSIVQETVTQSLERIREKFTTAVRTKRRWVRIDTVMALGQIGDKRSVEPLIALLENSNLALRKAAAEALMKIGDARAVEPLIELLWSSNIVLRKTAAAALVKIGDARAVEPLDNYFLQESKSVAYAFEMIGDVQVVRGLVERINNPLDHGEKIVGQLELMLWHGASRMATTELRILAHLNDAYRNVYPDDPGGDITALPIYCSVVRELAKQELIRRGLLDSSNDTSAEFNTNHRHHLFDAIIFIMGMISFYMLSGYAVYVISKWICH